MERTLTPKQQARRSNILMATRELVAAHGYDGMIMRDVAERAGVSPTTLYNLYNTKDELLLEALRESVAEGWLRASKVVPELGLERLLEQMRQAAKQVREQPTYARAIAQALFRANTGDQIVQTLVTGNQRAVINSLQVMQSDGELIDTDLHALARNLVANFWANFFLWINDELAIEALEDALLRTYLTHLFPVTTGTAHQTIRAALTRLL